ncbi:hypothetical protein B7463_g934, partial [Scytalidium lignicola]
MESESPATPPRALRYSLRDRKIPNSTPIRSPRKSPRKSPSKNKQPDTMQPPPSSQSSAPPSSAPQNSNTNMSGSEQLQKQRTIEELHLLAYGSTEPPSVVSNDNGFIDEYERGDGDEDEDDESLKWPADFDLPKYLKERRESFYRKWPEEKEKIEQMDKRYKSNLDNTENIRRHDYNSITRVYPNALRIRKMTSLPENFLTMSSAYRKVWANTAYSSLGMLADILEANHYSMLDFLHTVQLKDSGRKLNQLGLSKIPENEIRMQNAYESCAGLCTAFTFKVIQESGRSHQEFTIGNNGFHRLAWDGRLLICSSKKKVVTIDESCLGAEGFSDQTLESCNLFQPVQNWSIAMEICYNQLLKKDNFLMYFRDFDEQGNGFNGMIKWDLKMCSCYLFSGIDNSICSKAIYNGKGTRENAEEWRGLNTAFLNTKLVHGTKRMDQADKRSLQIHYDFLELAPTVWGFPVLELAAN